MAKAMETLKNLTNDLMNIIVENEALKAQLEEQASEIRALKVEAKIHILEKNALKEDLNNAKGMADTLQKENVLFIRQNNLLKKTIEAMTEKLKGVADTHK